MTKPYTLIDDALLAPMAGGLELPIAPVGAAQHGEIGPCPNPDAFPKPAPNPDPFPVQPFPFQPGGK